MYILYGSAGTGSASVEAALAEAGATFEKREITTSQGQHLTETFTSINPRQQVPALALPDGRVMSEGSAMMLHIADAFPASRLAPLPGTSARAVHDRWLAFMAVNLYEGELRKAYPDRYTDDPAGAGAVQTSADAYVKRHYEILEKAAAGPFLLGEQPTMADIYLWMLAGWMDRDWLGYHCPRVLAIVEVIAARPAIAPSTPPISGEVMKIEGRCHCGHVSYEAEIDPETVTICHCTDCQRLTGSAFRVTALASHDDVRLTANPPKLYKKRGDNGRVRHQYFCPECGSPMFTTGEGEDAAIWGVRVGTIDQRNQLAPKRQMWCRSAQLWVSDIPSLPAADGDSIGYQETG